MDNSMLMGMTDTEDKRTSIKDIFQFLTQSDNIEQKTLLCNDNIEAIIKMKAVNSHLKAYFGFTIELYDILIDEKRSNIISLYGQGRKDLLKVVENMQTQVNTDDKLKIL